MSKANDKSSQEKQNEGNCLIEGCEKLAVSRGLCGTCLQTAHRLQKQGKVTFDSLVEKGLMLPAKRRSKSLFIEALENS